MISAASPAASPSWRGCWERWPARPRTAGRRGSVAIDGMAGVGKTTLAVHAAHRLTGRFPDGQFFLSLHAHTPGQRPVDPADALASLLLTAGVAAPAHPARPGGPRRPVA